MQHFFESIVIALQALWANKLRSSLTVLCVVISIMSIIAVVSIVDGMDSYVKEKIANQGSNVFTVQRLNFFEIATDFDKFLESLKNPAITMEDLEHMQRDVEAGEFFDATVSRSLPMNSGSQDVENIDIRGRTETYPAIGEFELESGRHLSRLDVQQRRNVCVLGWDVAQSLFPNKDPLQEIVKIAGKHFTVIGICEQKPSILGSNQNQFAFIPVTTYFKYFGSRRQSVDIQIRTADMESFTLAQEQARMTMRIRHKLEPADPDDFYVSTSEQLVTFWEAIASVIFGTLVGIVSITLVVGGIIIMNVMLVAVTERTREVGIRKALGAKRYQITSQFLVESVILTTIGGIIGIVFGFTAANLVAAFSPLPYRIAIWSVVAALIITFIVGVFFGVYPARKAARLDPVEALRMQ